MPARDAQAEIDLHTGGSWLDRIVLQNAFFDAQPALRAGNITKHKNLLHGIKIELCSNAYICAIFAIILDKKMKNSIYLKNETLLNTEK